MAFLSDFKQFAFKGNVVDLAVGVVIGGAFQKIVTQLVADIVMPIVSLILPGGDWRDKHLVLRDAVAAANGVPAVTEISIKYGDFIGAVLDFLIVALVLFIVVSRVIKAAEGALNKKKEEPSKEPATKTCPFCLETVPFKASRCKACTSTLETVPEAAPAT